MTERRERERRKGERRGAPRGDADRRRVERRCVGAGIALALMLGAVPAAQAQIYTRRNTRGVIEATNVPDARDYRLTYPGKGVLIHSAGFNMKASNSTEFNAHINEASALHGVSVDLVRAVIQVESEFDPLAVSSVGAQGLMQLMPETARRFGVADSFDPRQNIFGGVKYLRFLLDMFQGDVALTCAAYNAGENAVLRFGGVPPYKETRGYVRKVQAVLTSISRGLQAAFFTPRQPPSTVAIRTAPALRPPPRLPRVYYRWKDAVGILHVEQSPPLGAIAYTTVRSVD